MRKPATLGRRSWAALVVLSAASAGSACWYLRGLVDQGATGVAPVAEVHENVTAAEEPLQPAASRVPVEKVEKEQWWARDFKEGSVVKARDYGQSTVSSEWAVITKDHRDDTFDIRWLRPANDTERRKHRKEFEDMTVYTPLIKGIRKVVKKGNAKKCKDILQNRAVTALNGNREIELMHNLRNLGWEKCVGESLYHVTVSFESSEHVEVGTPMAPKWRLSSETVASVVGEIATVFSTAVAPETAEEHMVVNAIGANGAKTIVWDGERDAEEKGVTKPGKRRTLGDIKKGIHQPELRLVASYIPSGVDSMKGMVKKGYAMYKQYRPHIEGAAGLAKFQLQLPDLGPGDMPDMMTAVGLIKKHMKNAQAPGGAQEAATPPATPPATSAAKFAVMPVLLFAAAIGGWLLYRGKSASLRRAMVYAPAAQVELL